MGLTEIQKKVGQLMVVGFKQGEKQVSPEIKQLIREHHVGGVILFTRNIGTPEETLALTTELQLEAKKAGHEHPLLICIDQENGLVRRLGEGTTIFPGSKLLGATKNPENAYEVGVATGKELKHLGINWNLAPVLDVNNNPLNPVIGVRSFGESAEKVSAFGQEAMRGMQDAGIITTLKHFPGHGDTNVDSHLDLPTISHSMERLEKIELKPFAECIKQGADTVMSAHVYFPAIETSENVPATLSKKVITGLLREKLEFDGVVTTDCMEMKAISDTIGTARGGVEAIKAGVDLVMVSHTFASQVDTMNEILNAIDSGEIEESTIDEAYKRVCKLKDKYLKWDDIQLNGELIVSPEVGSKQHEDIALDIYRQGVTIVKNEKNILPLPKNSDHRILVVYPENNANTQVEDKKYLRYALGETIQDIQPSADVIKLSNPPMDDEIQDVVQKAQEYQTVIVGTITATHENNQVKLVEKLHENGTQVVVIATRSPYDLSYFPSIPAYMCTYEFTYPALKTAAEAIFGEKTVSGTLPVTLPNY